MCWYLQQPGKGLQLLYHSVGPNQLQEGDIHTGYKADQLNLADFSLDISPVKMNHSAVYFCGSSLDTTLQSHWLSLHKILSFPAPSLRSSQHRKGACRPIDKPDFVEELEQEKQNRSLKCRLIAQLLFPGQLFILYLIRTINKDC